ncbi:MAG: hypothetical protein CM1200mP20_09440 [Pseudomonadota bacterium]|nr:MAG: hypothetical protein CM1200mP20_09440 [Pseudomonadota bacterium]
MENRHDPFLPLAVAATNSRKTAVVDRHRHCVLAQPDDRREYWMGSAKPLPAAVSSWASGARSKATTSADSACPGLHLHPDCVNMREPFAPSGITGKTGAPLKFEGQHYRFSLMTPNFTPEPMNFPPPPITVAAVGPAMMKVAAEEYDGVRLHPFCTRKYSKAPYAPP